MTSHSDGDATDNDRAVVVGTVATVGSGVGNCAVVVGTVTTVGDGVAGGAVATRDADLRPLRCGRWFYIKIGKNETQTNFQRLGV